jgi:hypothetical protein
MTANDSEFQEESTIPEATVGDHWLRRALRLVQRELPGEHRLRFVAEVYNRHGAAAERNAMVQQVQERLQGAAPLAGVLPWTGQSAAPAQSAAPPQRLLGQPKPVAQATQWQAPPVASAAQRQTPTTPDLEARQDRMPASAQSRKTGEPALLSQEGPAETTAALPNSVARSLSLPLAPPVRNYLARTLDIRIPAVRIYANQAADQVARHQQADAVAYGRNILFRGGKYDPSTRQGLALLGHELTHVARGEASHPALPNEEAAALQNEQRMLDGFHDLPSTPLAAPPLFGPSSIGTSSPPPPSVPIQQPAPPTPQTAVTGRSLNEAGGREAGSTSLTAGQMQQIKDAVYRDLMDRIRTEFERGG